MEISTILNDLRRQMTDAENEVSAMTSLASDLRERLATVEAKIATGNDHLTALRMAVESLEMLERPRQSPEPAPVKKIQPRGPKAAKQIVRLNPAGEEVGVYRSINQCAKALGWSAPGVRKFIEVISPEKQVRMKGFRLEFRSE